MNIEQVKIFSFLPKDLKIAVALPFSIIGLSSISPITFAQSFAYEPFGDAVYSNFYQNIGFFYIYDVTLQATIVPELCKSGFCPQKKGVDVILSTNTPSCPNGSLEGWVSVTFTSEDNKAIRFS